LRNESPGFNKSAEPQIANELWKKFNKMIADYGVEVKEGVFGAYMEVELINDGPVTIRRCTG
jgi:D-tyrosyl-tRNA(Tyr) deacylase